MSAQKAFTEVADDVSGTPFTVTTIPSGFSTSTAFQWHGQVVSKAPGSVEEAIMAVIIRAAFITPT